MKISKSKQELARIISENGGWREGAGYLAMDTSGMVCGYLSAPKWSSSLREWTGSACFRIFISTTLAPNHQRTILSREEYLFLHQNQGLEDALDEPMVEAKPTIEQLASDYRNAKDYAGRKQQEADDAKADADEKLRVLEIAGEALGLLVSPITSKQEPELVITNRSQLELGDVIWLSDSTVKENNELTPSGEYTVVKVGVIGVESDGQTIYPDFSTREWRFIRRP